MRAPLFLCTTAAVTIAAVAATTFRLTLSPASHSFIMMDTAYDTIIANPPRASSTAIDMHNHIGSFQQGEGGSTGSDTVVPIRHQWTWIWTHTRQMKRECESIGMPILNCRLESLGAVRVFKFYVDRACITCMFVMNVRTHTANSTRVHAGAASASASASIVSQSF